MVFDILRFFDERRIEYDTSGPNVSKGNVTIHCPFCGTADPGRHLSVSTAGHGWRCWRRPQDHRGKGLVRLIQALIGCSAEQARSIAGVRSSLPAQGDLLGSVERMLGMGQKEPEARTLKLLPEFRPFAERVSARPFLNYMRDRGFPDPVGTADRYGLRYAVDGPFRSRIIFPIEFERQIVNWTGRSISSNATLRYRTLSTDVDDDSRLPAAVGAITEYLLFWDRVIASDADTLVLCEGPFDALKLCELGRRHGIVATCFFTSAPTDDQESLLYELLPRFKNRFLLLDRGTIAQAISIAARLKPLGLRRLVLPDGIKDPGDLKSIDFLLQEA